MPYTEIPTNARGTHTFGGDQYHQRLDSRGELMLVAGPDTRDWSAIDKGALDYTKIAAQEHAVQPFAGHDGPKTAAACAVCAAGPSSGDLIADQTRKLIAAKKAGMNLPDGATVANIPTIPTAPVELVGPVPAVPDADTAAQIELRAMRATLAEQQAKLDAREKALLTPKVLTMTTGPTGAADPAHNAGIPPTDPDVVAGASPDIQAQSLAAGVDPAAVAAVTPASEAPKMDPQIQAEMKGMDDMQAALGDLPPSAAGMGVDPWTGDTVKVTNLPGADATAPYGRKGDGTPRAKPGRATGVPQGQ